MNTTLGEVKGGKRIITDPKQIGQLLNLINGR
jgi:hypothetical protein